MTALSPNIFFLKGMKINAVIFVQEDGPLMPPRLFVSLSHTHTYSVQTHLPTIAFAHQIKRRRFLLLYLIKTHAQEQQRIWCSFLHQWPNALKFSLCSEHHCFNGRRQSRAVSLCCCFTVESRTLQLLCFFSPPSCILTETLTDKRTQERGQNFGGENQP